MRSSLAPFARCRRVPVVIQAGILLFFTAVAACGGDGGITDTEEDDPCDAITPISVGSSVTGTLSSDDCMVDERYQERWELDLDEATTILIDLESDNFPSRVELRRSNGSQIAAGNDAGGYHARIIEELLPGSYVIVATTYAPGFSGRYSLEVSVAPDCSPVGTVALGDTVSGTLEVGDCAFELADVSDNWSLTLESSDTVRIGLESPDFTESVGIRDSSGEILTGSVSYEEDRGAWMEVPLSAGSYTVIATTFEEGEDGAYELVVERAPPCTPGAPLVLGETVAGELVHEDCWWGYGRRTPSDTWELSVDSLTTVNVHLKSMDFPPTLFLNRPGEGILVGGAPPQTPGVSAILGFPLEAGTYEVVATSWASWAEGAYTVTAEAVECSPPQPIAVGDTLSGELSTEDCARAGGARRDLWSLTLTEEAAIRIDQRSSELDPYLILEDDAGEVVAEDDDGGDDLDARIESTLAAGTYLLVATSYGLGDDGSYELSVTPIPAETTAAPGSPWQTAEKVASPPLGGLPVIQPRAPEAAWP